MENQNPTGQDLSKLKDMFSNFQRQQAESSSKPARINLLAKYFTPRQPKEIFRILPPKEGKNYIEDAFFHVASTNASGGKIKHGTVIYCPAHNDPKVPKLDANGQEVVDANGKPFLVPAPCPLCDKHANLLKTQDPSTKGIKKDDMNDMQLAVHKKNSEIYKEAIKWEAKKFYIVRGIDKGAEKDGVKFWRFKHHFRNQGTLDKLLPSLENYMTNQQADFSDVINGTDLDIMMVDSEFNGHTFKAISAILPKGKSPLHQDNAVVNAWLNDEITWRDVYLPKKAPNTTPFEFLQMVAMGTNPYWDDTDQSNKHWVFPGRPDLEEQANTRSTNLDAPAKPFEQASDLTNQAGARITMDNITPANVGTFQDDSSNLGQEVMTSAPAQQAPAAPVNPLPTNLVGNGNAKSAEDYDDLPF